MTGEPLRHYEDETRRGWGYCGARWVVSRTLMLELDCPQCVTLWRQRRRERRKRAGS